MSTVLRAYRALAFCCLLAWSFASPKPLQQRLKRKSRGSDSTRSGSSEDAHNLVGEHGFGGLPFAKQLIAEAMLGQMEDLLPESAEVSKESLEKAMQCAKHLTVVLRTLTKPQRQKWVSLLVRALQIDEGQAQFRKTLISDLMLLWRVDDDPRRTYAEAEQQLKAFSMHASRHLRLESSTTALTQPNAQGTSQ